MRLSPAAAEAIRRESLAAYVRGPKGGVESGGILYGRQRNGETEVAMVRPVPCRHAFGPAFRLSDDEQAAMTAGLRAPDGMEVVGWYRSCHSPNRSSPDGHDVDLHRRHFSNSPAPVLLLVRPSLRGPIACSVYRPGTDAEVQTFHLGAPEVLPPPKRKSLISGFAAGAAAGALLLLLVLVTREADTGPLPNLAPGLSVDVEPAELVVKWNRNAPQIREAESGAVIVEDGALGNSIPLQREDLLRGFLALARRSSETTLIRLRLNVHGRTTEETALVVTPPREPALAAAMLPAAPLPAPTKAAEPRARSVNRSGDPPARPAPPAEPLMSVERPSAPQPKLLTHSGRLVWTGSLEPGQVLELFDGRPSRGELNGALPERLTRVTAWPAERGRVGVVVHSPEFLYDEPPSKTNGWTNLRFRFDPQTSSEIEVIERPSAANGWRARIRNGSKPASMLYLQWEGLREETGTVGQ
ncbi:MAG: hypothetical protein SFV54_23015 [Bryobacteraceae bacterium]|nr:hypothetical protein [Bryobacteraceae bacterium]